MYKRQKVSSETVDTKITKEPVDKVVLMGTKGSNVSNPVGTFTDMNGNTCLLYTSRRIEGNGQQNSEQICKIGIHFYRVPKNTYKEQRRS